jgi:large subunit ribosomal protein L25
MSEVSLRAQAGRTVGSRESRRLRRQGDVPAIVYGTETDPLPVSVDAHALQLALHTEAGSNALINLEIEGGDTVLTMARVIDRHPFRSEYRHVDFVTVSRDETATADVTIDFIGTPVGVLEGGVFSPRRTTVEIEVLITNIPSSIELDVSEVAINGSLRIEDMPALDGVTYTEDPEAVVMSVTVPAAEIEEEPEIDEELLELEDGEEAPEGEADEAAEGEAEGEDEGTE